MNKRESKVKESEENKDPKLIKKKSKILMRNNNYVMEGAFDYALETSSDIIICGHTHHADLIQRDNKIYANTGTFESSIPTAICIDEDKICLYQWHNKKFTLLKDIKFKLEE